MKISRKLNLFTVGVIVAFCLSAVLLVMQMDTLTNGYDRLLNSQVQSMEQARVIQVDFKKQVQEWKDILLRGHDPKDLATYTKQFHEKELQVRSEASQLAGNVDDPECKELLAKFLNAHGQLDQQYELAYTAYVNGNFDFKAADKIVRGKDRPPTDLFDQIVNRLDALVKQSAAAQQQTAAKARTHARVWAFVLVVANLLVGGFMAFFISRSVDTVLTRAIHELTDGAEHVANAAAQVSASSQSLAQGSSEQAASLEETSASSEEINSMARKNTDNSRSAADLVSSSQQKFVATNRALEQTVLAMDEIDSQSGKISKIIKTIDEIAFQTNILALNAAVEAARAGEAGMGFAVVADEVRNLSQRAAQAAKDTSSLIEESIAKSNDGKVKVDQVAAAIQALTSEAATIRTLVDEVSLGSQEQARGIEQIVKAIGQMEQVTQRTASNAEESASAAEELTAQSETLKDVVGHLSQLVDGNSKPAYNRSVSKPSSLKQVRRSLDIASPRPVSSKSRATAASVAAAKAFPLEAEFHEF